MSRIAFGILGFLAVMIAAPQFSQSTPSTPSNTETAQFDAYQRPNGDAYFALALTPQAALPSAPACELVVLFDTSASQLGKYREKGLEVLRGLLATLGDHDRVKLMAVDVNAIPLTDTFVDPRGSEMQAALDKLNRRVPLGATDLEAALKSAADSYQDRPLVQRAAVYIGDGQSNANFAGVDVAGLIDRLLKCRLSVHSFAVGPAPDASNLAALANQTGGVVALDGDRVLGPEIGAQLAHATHGPVIWPIERKLPTSLAEIVPVKTPPLRADRESILLGKGSVAEDFPVEIKGEVAGQPIDLNWTVAPPNPMTTMRFWCNSSTPLSTTVGTDCPRLVRRAYGKWVDCRAIPPKEWRSWDGRPPHQATLRRHFSLSMRRCEKIPITPARWC